eukprot:Nk52_evm17s62 gene=Nk52_evmTU17s62
MLLQASSSSPPAPPRHPFPAPAGPVTANPNNESVRKVTVDINEVFKDILTKEHSSKERALRASDLSKQIHQIRTQYDLVTKEHEVIMSQLKPQQDKQGLILSAIDWEERSNSRLAERNQSLKRKIEEMEMRIKSETKLLYEASKSLFMMCENFYFQRLGKDENNGDLPILSMDQLSGRVEEYDAQVKMIYQYQEEAQKIKSINANLLERQKSLSSCLTQLEFEHKGK